jgi:uncharacterized protein
MEKKEEEEVRRLKKKLASLIVILKRMQKVAIAYSGGVDSSLLLKIARQNLGENVLAVTADSPIYPQEELRFARRITKDWEIKHRIIKVDLLRNTSFIKNPINRCYYCKRELFRQFWDIARRFKINFVLDGGNASDYQDFRPGNQAKREFNIRSPLEECAINKQDVYQLSKLYSLPTRNKPATVCLASRIPYGQPILLKDLRMIQQAETFIRGFGFKQVRLRHYNLDGQLKLARIELDRKDMPGFSGFLCLKVSGYLKRLGYSYITLDLEGYRPGSLNY